MSGSGPIYEYQRELTAKLEQVVRERDEARDEVETLRAAIDGEPWGGAALKRQRDEAVKRLGVTLEELWTAEKERDEARAEVERLRLDNADLLARLDAAAFAVPQGLRTVAERQREACAKSVEVIQLPRRSWEDGEQSIGRYDGIEDAAEKVRATPLVTEGQP